MDHLSSGEMPSFMSDEPEIIRSTSMSGVTLPGIEAIDSVKVEAGSALLEDTHMAEDDKDEKEKDIQLNENDQSGSDDPSMEQSPSKTGDSAAEKPDKEGENNEEKDMDREEEGPSHGKSKREKQEEERLKMQVLVSHFSEDQLNRYEMFRRAAFPKAAVKRHMQSITGAGISQNVVIAMSGIAKVFVGEIVESALDVKGKWNESGPLQPKHLREAVRVMKHDGAIPNTKWKKKLLR